MLIELARNARQALRPLYSGFPGLHGCLDAALEGVMGTAVADNETRPAVAWIHLEFHLLAGDPNSEAAEQVVRSLPMPASIVATSDAWAPLIRRVWGEAVRTRTRVSFRPGAWDTDRLRRLVEALPSGFSLRRVTQLDAGRFAELADSLVYNYASHEDFAASGVGFGIEHQGRFVAGCSSFARSSRSIEFEIQTHPEFRRRGFASAAAAAMIEYCIDRGLEPCWDAHNEMSADLATKLGFVDPAPYTAHELAAKLD